MTTGSNWVRLVGVAEPQQGGFIRSGLDYLANSTRPSQYAGAKLQDLLPELHRCTEWLDSAVRETNTGPLLLLGYYEPAKTKVAAAIFNAFIDLRMSGGAFVSDTGYIQAISAARSAGGEKAASAVCDAHASARLLVIDGLGMAARIKDMDLLPELLLERHRRGRLKQSVITTHFTVQTLHRAIGSTVAGLLFTGATAVEVPTLPFRAAA